MLFYPNSVLQLRIPSVIDNAFYQFYASFSHALLLETKLRPANRIGIVMPDTAGKLPFLGPALRAAGHGARRPDRGEFLFLKQGGTILLERQ